MNCWPKKLIPITKHTCCTHSSDECSNFNQAAVYGSGCWATRRDVNQVGVACCTSGLLDNLLIFLLRTITLLFKWKGKNKTDWMPVCFLST